MQGKQQTTGATWPVRPYDLGLVAVALVAGLIAVASTLTSAAPPPDGGVLGAVQVGPSAAGVDSPKIVASPSMPPAASVGEPEPSITVGTAMIRTWKDSFARSRLQVIVPVRNDGDRWVRFPDSVSTYQLLAADSEVQGGSLFALPAAIGPGDVSYLVDTVSFDGAEDTRDLMVTTDVVTLPTDPPENTLAVTEVRFTTGVGGGVLASGAVRNEGPATTRRVIAGAIALDRDGSPLAALYDSFDIGALDAGQARDFVTDSQPGAPPIAEGDLGETIGVAFEANS
jgi:hypothetical protein